MEIGLMFSEMFSHYSQVVSMFLERFREYEDIIQVHMDESSNDILKDICYESLKGGGSVTVSNLHHVTDKRPLWKSKSHLPHITFFNLDLLIGIRQVNF
jgi:hypothetical protein